MWYKGVSATNISCSACVSHSVYVEAERRWIDLASRHPAVNSYLCLFPLTCATRYPYLRKEDVSTSTSTVEVREGKAGPERHWVVQTPILGTGSSFNQQDPG